MRSAAIVDDRNRRGAATATRMEACGGFRTRPSGPDSGSVREIDEKVETTMMLVDMAMAAIRSAASMAYHGTLLNERYLHHFISGQLQAYSPLLNVCGKTPALALHPEWPTSKRCAGLSYGKYCLRNGRYLPTEEGSSGFVDFALGEYARPEIGIELTLKLNGWSHEDVTYDLVKLLDGRNPFRAVISLNILLRPNGVAKGRRKDALERRMNEAYQDALSRFSGRIQPKKVNSAIIVAEIGRSERRHWFYNAQLHGFVESENVPSALL
jgi:hypothetical protein